VKGFFSSDIAAVGDDSVSDFEFGEVTSASGLSFDVASMSGILGLAYRAISV